MLNEETQEKLAELVVDKIEELNKYIIEEIGKSLLEIGKLTPSKAYQLEQTIKYGASYNKIIKKIKDITKLNEKEIDNIFKELAKKNQQWAKVYYDYRGLDFIPYGQNKALQNQVKAIAKITKDTYRNIMQTSAYSILKGNKTYYTPISKIYQDVLDEAVISISQGKETYNQSIRRIMKELTSKGLRQVDYSTGYSRRLDSSVRMNVLDGMRQLSNEVQRQFGEEFNADGIEISVHLNPAPDHNKIQGRQFSTIKPSKNKLSEWEKLQNGKKAKDYKGNIYSLDHDDNGTYRPISTMNCYHYIFSIILGVNKPQYSDEQLKQINSKNTKGFDFEGKHYTMYEGTQLQRKIETEIRKQKDIQIGARSINDIEEIEKSQNKIRKLSQKYKKLSEVSGLKTKKEKLSVSGYRRIAKSKLK